MSSDIEAFPRGLCRGALFFIFLFQELEKKLEKKVEKVEGFFQRWDEKWKKVENSG
ncbi:MAG: hypothetical protein FWC28_03495 [Proteobacteria bacterium]|nr:hypothetical protein [Cystobacterineae bacterium]MCL2258744.1 hypothetical protein [Cystobacterineae bacterium]MCL2314304.1 hypothetical protein [Pseudomonadota bacterium]